MSYIPSVAAQNLAVLTRQILEQHARGAKGRKANVRAAAARATKELARRVKAGKDSTNPAAAINSRAAIEKGWDDDSARAIEKNRVLLTRLAYRWRKGQTLQEDAWLRARSLLNCLKKGGLKVQAYSIDKEKEFRKARLDSDWTRPARPSDKSALLLAERRKCKDEQMQRLNNEAAHFLPGGPLPQVMLGSIDTFRKEALEKGHDKRRVEYALRRFLAPFCAYGRTGGIERHWHELTPKQQKIVVHNGLAVEKAWLGDSPLFERVWLRDLDAKPTPSSS